MVQRFGDVEVLRFEDVCFSENCNTDVLSRMDKLRALEFVRTNLTDEMLASFLDNTYITGVSVSDSALTDRSLLRIGTETSLTHVVLDANRFLSARLARDVLRDLLPDSEIHVHGKEIWSIHL